MKDLGSLAEVSGEALGNVSNYMHSRRTPLKPGTVAWIELRPGDKLAGDERVTIVSKGSTDSITRVRGEDGVERDVAHWLPVAWEFEVRSGVWLHEDNPSLWPRLAACVKELRAEKWSAGEDIDRLDLINQMERLLRRNGWEP
jgi:hypothetical protein